MTAKYIITEDYKVILFSISIKHDSFKSFNPISAGYVEISTQFVGGDVVDIVYRCYGNSESLKLNSNHEDKDIIELEMLTFSNNTKFKT